MTFLKGTSDTTTGTYAIAVTTVGERAVQEAGTDQTAALAKDEILTINGVSVSLTAGMSQTQVVNRINEFTSQTGVIADPNAGATRIYTNAFGSDSSLSVVSNVAAAADSSGFGTTELTDAGVDVIGTIGGTDYTGVGNVLTANSGAEKGRAIQFAASTGANAFETVTGAQGNATVTNNSLVFQIGANQDQTASIAIQKVNPNGLGVGVTGNQFSSLDDVEERDGGVRRAVRGTRPRRGDLPGR